MTCPTCEATPQPKDDLPFTDWEELYSASHEDVALCKCKECGQLFAYYSWELVDWTKGDDEIRSYWVPVTREEAQASRASLGVVQELLKARRHLARKPDGSFEWRCGGFFGPDFPPAG